jgi:hypothetical protein
MRFTTEEQDSGRPEIGVLIKTLTDAQAQSPQGDVVRDIERTNRAEIDCA